MILYFILNLLLTKNSYAEDNGAYLARTAGCINCHTSKSNEILGGGIEIRSPFGTFITPNISPDKNTGIGNWNEEQFFKAIRKGVSPEGYIYYPAFPYGSFTKLSDSDLNDIFIFLKSMPPIKNANRRQEIKFPFDQRWLLKFWQFLFFKNYKDRSTQIKVGIGPYKNDPSFSPKWNRGAYLVEGALHCTECHTPRGKLGDLIVDQWMSGSDISFLGKTPPNITPDKKTGITWTKEQWEQFLASGFTPKLTNPSYEMAQVIQQTSGLTKEDREAVVEYLIHLEPVSSFQ